MPPTGSWASDHRKGGGESRSDAIRRQIERTRDEIDCTINEFKGRLRPTQVVHQMTDVFRESAGDIMRQAGHVVRDNPVPIALLGAGLTWLAVSQARSKTAGARPEHEDPADDAGDDEFADLGEYGESAGVLRGESPARPSRHERTRVRLRRRGPRGQEQTLATARPLTARADGNVQPMQTQAREAMQHMSRYMKDKAADIGAEVQDRAQRARDWLGQTLDEHPLVVGASFFAIGLAIGLSVPRTRQEDRLVGPARHRLFGRVQHAGARLIDRGQDAAQRAVGALKEVIAREAEA
jgi:hypothetical protein